MQLESRIDTIKNRYVLLWLRFGRTHTSDTLYQTYHWQYHREARVTRTVTRRRPLALRGPLNLRHLCLLLIRSLSGEFTLGPDQSIDSIDHWCCYLTSAKARNSCQRRTRLLFNVFILLWYLNSIKHTVTIFLSPNCIHKRNWRDKLQKFHYHPQEQNVLRAKPLIIKTNRDIESKMTPE